MNDLEEFMCEDSESMLMNREEISVYLKKLKENCADYSAKLDQKVKDYIHKISECQNEVESSSALITQLNNKKSELKKDLEILKHDQKIIEKKTINSIEEQKKIKAEIEEIKKRREQMAFEVIDMEQAFEKTKENMKKQWQALKLSYKPYKDALDIRIDTEIKDEVEHATVTFFWSENPTDKNFSVVLTYQDDSCKVKKIEPELSTEHKYQLNHVVQFSKQSEVCNIRGFLCALRELFLKEYFD